MKSDLSKINLNLLVALDALLKEKHVTNAGKRLHITQSAMSNLLKQLRELFGDELFIRGQASRLVPTPYALSLEPHIREALQKVTLVFQEPTKFDPHHARHTFTIGLSDYTEFVLLPSLIQKITCCAPNIELVIKHLNYFENKSVFETENLDLTIGLYSRLPEHLIAQTLFDDHAVCVGDKDHPLLKKPVSLEDFAKARQLLILYYETREELRSEQWLRELGLQRQAVVTAPHTLAALYSLPKTQLIALALERVVKPFTQHLPLAYQKIEWGHTKTPASIQMVWHPKHKNDPAHQWLRETVLEIAKAL